MTDPTAPDALPELAARLIEPDPDERLLQSGRPDPRALVVAMAAYFSLGV